MTYKHIFRVAWPLYISQLPLVGSNIEHMICPKLEETLLMLELLRTDVLFPIIIAF